MSSRLPEPRATALELLVRDAGVLATGRGAARPVVAGGPVVRETPALTLPPSVAGVDSSGWAVPPRSDQSGKKVESIYATGSKPPRYDADLLEQLNEEYRSHPLVAQAPGYQAEALEAAGRRRVAWVHRMVDLSNKRTLEIGCGNGYEVWTAAHNLGADAHGVDVTHYGPWDALSDDRVHFTMADLAQSNPFPENHFDRVLSFTVWEHVVHPRELLRQTYRVLRPGGLAWIRANLYTGPQASHRYRQVFFPWPHLLFTDEVVAEWDARHGRTTTGSAWVNRLSYLHYEQIFADLGFEVVHRQFDQTPIDEQFYERFEDVLGRYPRWDLATDYFLVVLRKPR